MCVCSDLTWPGCCQSHLTGDLALFCLTDQIQDLVGSAQITISSMGCWTFSDEFCREKNREQKFAQSINSGRERIHFLWQHAFSGMNPAPQGTNVRGHKEHRKYRVGCIIQGSKLWGRHIRGSIILVPNFYDWNSPFPLYLLPVWLAVWAIATVKLVNL
jgi:hypothetical protein